MKRILEKFSPQCLLVLDGLDEHALGQNEDVISIIENRKYPNCKVIVTSRPHSTRDVEEHFYTIGRVEGFTQGTAMVKKRRIRVEDSTLVCVVIGGSPHPNFQFSAKKLQNNRLAHPLRELASPSENSWIRN